MRKRTQMRSLKPRRMQAIPRNPRRPASSKLLGTAMTLDEARDRKSTRLNSSHGSISYAVFCLISRLLGLFTFPYTTLFRSVPGVSKVEVRFEKKQVLVIFDDAKTNTDALVKATTNAGYPSQPEKAGK